MSSNPKTSSLDNKPRVIHLPSKAGSFAKLLGGPPDNICLRSGCVILEPGASVGRHSTDQYEELIVPLEGAGRLLVDGMEPIPFSVGTVVYSPPNTFHDVNNKGSVPLKYVYVVAR